jgi:hypothetical protein
VPTVVQHLPCKGASPPHGAAPLSLRSPVHVSPRLGPIAEQVVWARAMRGGWQRGGERLDAGLLRGRHPHPHGLGQTRGPLPSPHEQTVPL